VLGGVLTRCTALPHLERLSLKNIEVDDADFAPPFSAPNLRDLWLFNCGPRSMIVAELFFKQGLAADLLPPQDRTAAASECACTAFPSLKSCKHPKFEHVPGFGQKAWCISGFQQHSVPLRSPYVYADASS